jgi:hypothetical protein
LPQRRGARAARHQPPRCAVAAGAAACTDPLAGATFPRRLSSQLRQRPVPVTSPVVTPRLSPPGLTRSPVSASPECSPSPGQRRPQSSATPGECRTHVGWCPSSSRLTSPPPCSMSAGSVQIWPFILLEIRSQIRLRPVRVAQARRCQSGEQAEYHRECACSPYSHVVAFPTEPALPSKAAAYVFTRRCRSGH